MQFYCYVYYDENWQAYYVGKGQRRRSDWRADGVPIPANKYIKKFYFEHEWQAWECEIELIAFWKRQCDGGPLLNKSTGGKGGTSGCTGKLNPMYGRKHSDVTRKKLSDSHMGYKVKEETKAKISKTMKGIKKPDYVIENMKQAQRKRREREKQQQEAN